MKKTIAEVTFIRQNGKQVVNLKTAPEIEELFKNSEKVTSRVYKNSKGEPLTFYSLEERITDFSNKYNQQVTTGARVRLDDYGRGLMTDGYSNLSVLRTVGIGKGITFEVTGLVLDKDLKDWIYDVAYFLKFLYRHFIEKKEVHAVVMVDV